MATSRAGHASFRVTRRVIRVGGLVPLLAVALLIAACSRPAGPNEVEVAQVAIRANPALELVATDAEQGVLTVRVRRTGQLLTVKAADVNAGTAFLNIDLGETPPASAPGAASGSPASAAPATTPPAREAGASVDVRTPGVEVTARREEREPAPRATAAPSPARDRDTGAAAGGPGVVATVSGDEGDRRTRARVTTPGGVTLDATGSGRVTVTTGGRDAAAQTGAAPATSAGPASDTASPRRASSLDESRLERRTTPVSCGAGQNASLDGVRLEVPGVAVTVGGGCNMHIRGSLIIGGDPAIIVEPGANLHVEASEVMARGVAVRIESRSNGFFRRSTFHGRVVTQRGANLFDEGGNTFK